MNLLASAAATVILIAAVLTFYTGVLHLTRPKRTSAYKFRVLRDAIVALLALQLYFLARDWHLERPYLLYPFVTLLFVAGPLNYIRYYIFFYGGGKVPLRQIAQLIPAGLILLVETWFYFLGPGSAPAEMQRIFAAPLRHPASLLVFTGEVVLLGQFARLLALEWKFVNGKLRGPVLASSGITVLYMVSTVLITAGFFLTQRTVLLWGVLVLGLAGAIYLVFENRYPQFYQLVAQEERQQRYRKSLIQGLSRDKILDRLQQLMAEERVYRQLELRLEDVAGQLFITPHQLSEFVNDHLGMSFPAYVTMHRVGEAKQLLLSEPDQSALSIAFEVGFGSKQTFNTSFKQHTGMTPSEYRKTHAASENK
jgi:AraC-like DNA-binding protein